MKISVLYSADVPSGHDIAAVVPTSTEWLEFEGDECREHPQGHHKALAAVMAVDQFVEFLGRFGLRRLDKTPASRAIRISNDGPETNLKAYAIPEVEGFDAGAWTQLLAQLGAQRC